MTVWWVRSNDGLGGALDRNNLDAPQNSYDYDLATETTPDRRLGATDGVASPGENLDGHNNEKACQGAGPLTQKNGGPPRWPMVPRSPRNIERSVTRALLAGRAMGGTNRANQSAAPGNQ